MRVSTTYRTGLNSYSQVAPTSAAVPVQHALGYLLQLPDGLGVVNHTIGSPRQIQMSLRLNF